MKKRTGKRKTGLVVHGLTSPTKRELKGKSLIEYEVWLLTDAEFSQSYEVADHAVVDLRNYLSRALADFRVKHMDAVVLLLKFAVDPRTFHREFVEWRLIVNRSDGHMTKTLRAMIKARIRRYVPDFTGASLELRRGRG